MSVNKVILIGHLGQNPEVKHTPNGAAVCTMSVATNEVWNDKAGAKQERVEWNRVVVWNALAENCAKYLTKGRQVYVEGTLQTREWEKDGVKRYTTEVKAFTVQFLGANGTGDRPPAPSEQNGPATSNSASPAFTADDIPF